MVSLMDVLSLQRYLEWSEQMRQHFERLLNQGCRHQYANQGRPGDVCSLAYWYAGLYAVVEGWSGLKLTDPTIDELLASPNVDHLRRFRNGAFHYQRDYRDYSDRRFLEITEASGIGTLGVRSGARPRCLARGESPDFPPEGTNIIAAIYARKGTAQEDPR